MNFNHSHRLLLSAACCLLFFTGFSTTPGNNTSSTVQQPAKTNSPNKARRLSLEYDGLFYLKLSVQLGGPSDTFLLDIHTTP